MRGCSCCDTARRPVGVLAEQAVHGAVFHVGSQQIFVGLGQVAAQDADIGMAHQPLQGKDIHAAAQTAQGEAAVKGLQG